MRSFVSSLATVIMFSLLAVLFGCNAAGMKSESTANQQPQLPSTSPAGDGAARINVTDLREALNKGTAYVVDVRTDDQYKSGHIKGAVHIPEMDIAAHASELPRDKTIVTYCSWPAEHTSARAVLELKNKNITNAAALLGGYDAWKTAGLPIEPAK